MGRRWKAFSLAICLAGISFALCAQPSELPEKNIIFEQLPEKLGLSQSSINCILQDREGFLWVGTWSGLIRYDGYSTIVFHSDNAPDKIKSNKITTIYEDRKGNIWVGTHQGGLFRYDKNTNRFDHFKNSDDKHSLSDNNIWAIQEDKDGVLWIGTEHGLNRWNETQNTFRRFFTVEGDSLSLSQNIVTDLFLSSVGDFWIGTAYGLNKLLTVPSGDSVIYKFRNHLYVPDPIDYSYPHYVYQINETKGKDGKPIIWFTTQHGLRKLENGHVENFLTNDKTSGFNLFRSFVIVPGDQPYLLVGSELGLNFFDPAQKKFTRFLGYNDQDINLSHNTITSLYLDRGEVLWVGTKKGLNKFDSYSKNFQAHKTSAFDPKRNIITGIRNTLDGGYWISTVGGGLFKFDGNVFQHFQIKDQEKNDFTDFIQTLYTDTRGNVWIGTAGAGLYRFNEKELSKGSTVITRFDHFTSNASKPLSDNYIMSVVEDGTGHIWVGTWSGGLNRISPQGEVLQFGDALLRQAPLVVMHADHAGVLWIGTRGHGLYRVKPGDTSINIKSYQATDDEDSLRNNFVNAIYEDHAGGFWIGTEGGLNYFDRRSESFKTYNLANGPSNNVIVSILEDDFGKLWLAHWDGLSVIDPANSSFAKNYDSHDRIQGGFFYSNVCFKDQHGHLLFGGSEGFNKIDPSTVVTNPLKAKVVIQNLQLFNKPVSYGEEVDGRVILDKPLSEIAQVVLKHFENSVSIEFALLDYAAPEKTRYAYRLEGFDPEWNYTTAIRRYANYTNLSPGTYTFQVKATNNDGVWNEQISELKLVVQPPWWKTTWAAIIYFILAVLVLHAFRKLVLMRANFIHDLKLERVQRENMEKLNRTKLQFFTNISHEFRTPLTLILGPVHTLLESGEGGKFIRDQILSINTNAQRLLRLVNQLLDFRKAESGNLKLEVAEGNIARFVKEVKLSFDALASQMNIDFSFHSSSNIIQAWFDRDQFEKILFNLLSNAFKHTPEGGKISVQVIEEKDKISIIVEDSGSGIKREHFDHIFQTFFSYDEGHHQAGTGIGLALTKSLVDAHHGTIDVESKEHEFTRFTIQIAKGHDHFDESELMKESTDQDHIGMYPVLSPELLNDSESIHEPVAPSLDDLPKLLLVEDNAEVRAYMKSIFLGTYRVFEAENGKEGLDISLEEMPDLIISDVMMPLMDGITLCKRLKTNIKTSHIPVVLLTARTSLIFKVEGLETGADDYVTKPFNPKVLQLKVRNLIRTRESMHKTFRDNEVLTIEPKRVTLTTADEIFVEQMLESIEKNMSNANYSVEDLSVEVGLSRTQLYRKLKALTGQSANEFIRTIRLKRAAQLLEQNQLTIAEVTYEVGFNDLQYFRECFKKLFGLTPSEYSQRATGKQIAE